MISRFVKQKMHHRWWFKWDNATFMMHYSLFANHEYLTLYGKEYMISLTEVYCYGEVYGMV